MLFSSLGSLSKESQDRFVRRVISDSSTKPKFYECTREDKARNPGGRNHYATPEACKMGKCIVMAVCVLNYVRMRPVDYRVHGLAVGYAGKPLEPYSMVTDRPHTLPILQSKTAGDEFLAIDLPERSRSGKAHVFVARTLDALMDSIRSRYGTYQPGGFWTSFTSDDFKDVGADMYSIYSSAVHKVMQRLSESPRVERFTDGRMQARVQQFMFDVDTAHDRIKRMISTGLLTPAEEARLACMKDHAILQVTKDFLKSVDFDPSLRIKPKAHVQADLMIEAKEILDLLNAAYIGAQDLLDEYDMGNVSTRHLDKIIACIASIMNDLQKFIHDRGRAMRTRDRPVYFITGHGNLCAHSSEFVVPRGCTVVVVTPPGGVAYGSTAERLDGFPRLYDATFVQKVRNQSSDFEYYTVYYNEGSVMQEQTVEFTGYGAAPPPSRNYEISGLFKIPFDRFRIPQELSDLEGEIRISSLVGSQGPGIYVVHTCRTAQTLKDWQAVLKRDARVQKNKTVPRHLDICYKDVTMQKCMNMSEYGKPR